MEAIRIFKRGWRRGAALVAIFALLFHAALLVVHHPAVAATGEGPDGTITLCTSQGLTTVSLADLAGHGAPQQAPDKTAAAYCPICLGAQLAGMFVPPPAAAFRQPITETIVARVTPRAHVAAIRDFVRAQETRAPPSIV